MAEWLVRLKERTIEQFTLEGDGTVTSQLLARRGEIREHLGVSEHIGEHVAINRLVAHQINGAADQPTAAGSIRPAAAERLRPIVNRLRSMRLAKRRCQGLPGLGLSLKSGLRYFTRRSCGSGVTRFLAPHCRQAADKRRATSGWVVARSCVSVRSTSKS